MLQEGQQGRAVRDELLRRQRWQTVRQEGRQRLLRKRRGGMQLREREALLRRSRLLAQFVAELIALQNEKGSGVLSGAFLFVAEIGERE